MYGEYLATQALALAATKDVAAVPSVLHEARSLTSAVEVQTLAATAEAIMSIGTPQAEALASDALEIAVHLNTWDALICGVRAVPALLQNLVVGESTRRHVITMLQNSRDDSLLRASGLTTDRLYRRGGVLSPREHEVIDLLRQGLTNREIAKTLYISEATVKVHVQHILEKLRVRSRAQAVALYTAIADDASGNSSDLRPDSP
jgi:DNA-binding NarL/FixJ family response regulator